MKKVLLIVGGVSVLGYGLYKYFKTQRDLLYAFDYKIIGINIKKFSLTNIAMELSVFLWLFCHKESTGTKRQINPLASQKTTTPPPGANHNPKKEERLVDN